MGRAVCQRERADQGGTPSDAHAPSPPAAAGGVGPADPHTPGRPHMRRGEHDLGVYQGAAAEMQGALPQGRHPWVPGFDSGGYPRVGFRGGQGRAGQGCSRLSTVRQADRALRRELRAHCGGSLRPLGVNSLTFATTCLRRLVGLMPRASHQTHPPHLLRSAGLPRTMRGAATPRCPLASAPQRMPRPPPAAAPLVTCASAPAVRLPGTSPGCSS